MIKRKALDYLKAAEKFIDNGKRHFINDRFEFAKNDFNTAIQALQEAIYEINRGNWPLL